MRIVWDERKRAINLERHGFDFAEVAEAFDFTAAEITAGYSGRFKAVGTLDGFAVTIVFTALGTEGIALISVRRASRKERGGHAPSDA